VLDGRWRVGVARGTTPISAALRRTGVTPDQLTGLGLVLAAGAAAALAVGDLTAGAVLIGLCGLADLLDGPLATATGSASVRGAFFDSVADRLSDIFMLAGVAWYLVSVGSPYLSVLALGVLAASMLPSYVRAKADTLGLAARGGIMERAERMIVLGVAAFVQAYFVSVPVLVPALWLILALSLLTAGQRFLSGWRQASAGLATAGLATAGLATAGGSGVAGSGVAGSGAAVARADALGRSTESARRSDRTRPVRGDGTRSGITRPHMRGGSMRHPGEAGVRWRTERSHGLASPTRPGRPTRPGSRRQGLGGGDQGA
jgi:CDP-diacylglycerol--glycerol-3-phosphate 3-phosphatidyltransferase